MNGTRATGHFGLSTVALGVEYARQARVGAGSLRRAKTSHIDAGARSAGQRAAGVGARGIADRILAGLGSELAVGMGVCRRAMRAVVDGVLAGDRVEGNTIGYEERLELFVLGTEGFCVLEGVVEGHFGADELLFDGAQVNFFALTVGAVVAISEAWREV